MDMDRGHLPLQLKSNMPDWLWQRLANNFGEEEALQLVASLNSPASLDLRVNTLKSNR